MQDDQTKPAYTFDFGSDLPTGPCRQCLERIVQPGGAQVLHLELGQDLHVLGFYCPETAAGCHAIVGQNRDVLWHISQPVPVEQWLMEMNNLPAAFAQVQRLVDAQIEADRAASH